MAISTVVVLAAGASRSVDVMDDLHSTDAAIRLAIPFSGPPSTLGSRVCAAIAALAPTPPLAIVAFGTDALLLPAVALAQRAAHRRVSGYLLVEPALPPGSDTWPDAPVTVLDDAPGPQVRLRGWTALPLTATAAWLASGADT
jgi:hypothetical protein